MTRSLSTGRSSVGMVIAACLSAPCFIGIVLLPLGLGAVAASTLFVFLDEYRFIFMLAALVLLGVSHWALRSAREFRPTTLLWVLTIVTLALIAAELIVDSPWDRRMLVGRFG